MEFYRKSSGNKRVSLTATGLSLHGGTVELLKSKWDGPVEYVLVGFDEATNSIGIQPAHEDQKDDAFSVGKRMRNNDYVLIQSKGLVDFLEDRIPSFRDMTSNGQDRMVLEGQWDDEKWAFVASLDQDTSE